MNDHLRRACYYTNRGRLNATLFHELNDFFAAVGMGGEAEFVILAAGKCEGMGKGGEAGGSGGGSTLKIRARNEVAKPMSAETLLSVLVGIGLSAACGFRPTSGRCSSRSPTRPCR